VCVYACVCARLFACEHASMCGGLLCVCVLQHLCRAFSDSPGTTDLSLYLKQVPLLNV